MKKHLDLFAGIGGNSFALDRVYGEVEHIFCEIAEFPQAVLKKHWPKAKIYGDIKKLTGADIGKVDFVSGGFPCQPFSSAGKRRGAEDDRHLWPEMFRIIRETSPEWVVAENVSGILTWSGGMVVESILSDLEAANYEVWPLVIPACSVDAPHRRDRVWFIAHAIGSDAGRDAGTDARSSDPKRLRQRHAVELARLPDTLRLPSDSGHSPGGAHASRDQDTRPKRIRAQRSKEANIARVGNWNEEWPEAVARLCSLDDGLPGGLVRPGGWRNAALKAAGNAIVPQVAERIFRAIKFAEENKIDI